MKDKIICVVYLRVLIEDQSRDEFNFPEQI